MNTSRLPPLPPPPPSHHLSCHHPLDLLKLEGPISRNGFHSLRCSSLSSVRRRGIQLRASSRESPYQVLGLSPSASPKEIKRAYRKLALKYHPDVNKEANSQEKFMRIKHAYNTLINKKQRTDYTSSTADRKKARTVQEDEDFYGFGIFFGDIQITIGDFFRDLQTEFRNWESSFNSQEKPKSLWEELADIGEEFVEFLEKELKISESDDGNGEMPYDSRNFNDSRMGDAARNQENDGSSIEDSIDEVEAALAQLKKELGLQ